MTKSEAIGLIQEYVLAAERVAKEVGINHLFYNEQHIEVLIAAKLGHEYNVNTRGPDARDSFGDKVEYKTINIASSSKGSFQFHWISESKLASYAETKNIYFCVREGSHIKEIWELPMKVIIPDLIEKYEEAENKRAILVSGGIKKSKNIDAHKSYSLSTVKKLGAVKVYND
jgi:hypothetical protein